MRILDQSDKTAKTTTTTTATPQLVTEKSSGSTGAGTLSRPMTWQFYPLVVSSSLLLAYLTYLALRFSYSRSARAQRWVKRLAGKPPKEEKMLPFYLATGPHNLGSFLAVNSTQNYFLIASVFSFFCDL